MLQVALLLDRDGYGDVASPVLHLPLDPHNPEAMVAALQSDDVLGQLQALLALPVQVCMGCLHGCMRLHLPRHRRAWACGCSTT